MDRDGTINIDPGYLGDPDKVTLYSGVAGGIRRLKDDGYRIIVVSNQSGISRGLISREQVDAVNSRINRILSENSTGIDDFYYCPYHPDFDDPEKCTCRKPSPQMVFRAAEDHNLDLKKSFLVGDRESDIECGINSGVKTVLIKNTLTENQIISLQKAGKCPNFVAVDFEEVCDFILRFSTGGN